VGDIIPEAMADYSDNFQSPLDAELVEREYWEKLPLICKWSLRQFYVRLEQSNIRIWIIKNI
jgi:ribosomal protein L16 Arg81 hydroxylase